MTNRVRGLFRRADRFASLFKTYALSYLKSKKLAVNELKCFCLFVGYPRSGSSMIGSLIDAHPDAVIAHELHALRFVRYGFSKNQLFYLLLEQSERFLNLGSTWSGYSYRVPNQFNGRYRHLIVIGDKKAGDTAFFLYLYPNLLEKLKREVGVPVGRSR